MLFRSIRNLILVILSLLIVACNSGQSGTNSTNIATGFSNNIVKYSSSNSKYTTSKANYILDSSYSMYNWTWINGSKVSNAIGSYGTLGTSSVSNIPGGRMAMAKWSDSLGNLWIFGGSGCDQNGSCDQYNNRFNDLWKYDKTSNEWTWVSGSNLINQQGSYGTKDIPNTRNIPGNRFFSMSTQDASGNFWLFGGNTIITPTNTANMNDLWKYSVSNNTWNLFCFNITAVMNRHINNVSPIHTKLNPL